MRRVYRLAGRLAGAMLGVLALIACEDAGRVTPSQVDPSYSPDELSFAANNGGLATIILGNPGEQDAERFNAHVTEAMSAIQQAPKVDFTTRPGPQARTLYRVVMVFNPQEAIGDADLCRGRLPRAGTLASEITLRAVFCRGETPLTGASGWIDYDVAQDERRFRRFMQDVTVTLFPQRQR